MGPGEPGPNRCRKRSDGHKRRARRQSRHRRLRSVPPRKRQRIQVQQAHRYSEGTRLATRLDSIRPSTRSNRVPPVTAGTAIAPEPIPAFDGLYGCGGQAVPEPRLLVAAECAVSRRGAMRATGCCGSSASASALRPTGASNVEPSRSAVVHSRIGRPSRSRGRAGAPSSTDLARPRQAPATHADTLVGT